MLPNLPLLEKIQSRILEISNRQGEFKRQFHYGLFLLCYGVGLRISEAINFNPLRKTHKGLYRLNKTKGKKQRFVYIPKSVISELKKNDWKPNSTNRFNFYHFLKKIKREINLPTNIELTPHTLRRSFATYHAESGLPLPLLSKLLGHSSIRTTALYWMNIYNEDNDPNDILTAKIWPKKPKKPQPESESLVNLNLDELPELLVPNSLFSETPPNYLTKIQHLEQQLNQIQSEKDKKITELTREKEKNANLRQDLNNLNEQNTTLCQEKAEIATEKDKIISQLTQELASERKKLLTAENNLTQEKALLFTQRQSNQSLQETNANLTKKIHAYEQNYTNLTNNYQNAIKDKENTEKQLNNLVTTIKTATKEFHQWQKINYYQALEKEQGKFKAQIIQPPPWKIK